MFLSGYYPDYYFAPRYWPKVGADSSPVGVYPLIHDFLNIAYTQHTTLDVPYTQIDQLNVPYTQIDQLNVP